MASEAYGKLQNVYHADPIKLLANLLVGLFLLGLGIVAVIAANDQGREMLILVGILTGLGGLMILLRTMTLNFGHEIRFYEKGVELRWFWHSRHWLYDQITGVQVTAVVAQRSRTYLVRGYIFFDDEIELFRVDPVYFRWHRVAQRLMNRIAQLHNQRDMQQIKDGFEIVYDELIPIPHLGRHMVLKVNLYGVLEEGKPLLPWSGFGDCAVDSDDRGMVVITSIDGQIYSCFPYYNTINSIPAMRLIKAVAETRRNI